MGFCLLQHTISFDFIVEQSNSFYYDGADGNGTLSLKNIYHKKHQTITLVCPLAYGV